MIISHAKDCTIKIYIKAVFDEDLKALIIDGEHEDIELITALETIREEYSDITGAAKTGTNGQVRQINALQVRLQAVAVFIKLHRDCLKEVGEPFHPAIKDLEKFGYKLKWNKDKAAFEKQLQNIEQKEKRHRTELEKKIEALQSNKQEQQSIDEARKIFLTNLNNLSRFGFDIDKDKTTVEELALMTKEYEAETARLTQQKKKR